MSGEDQPQQEIDKQVPAESTQVVAPAPKRDECGKRKDYFFVVHGSGEPTVGIHSFTELIAITMTFCGTDFEEDFINLTKAMLRELFDTTEVYTKAEWRKRIEEEDKWAEQEGARLDAERADNPG